MPQKEVAIVGKNNTKAHVTGQNELLVTMSNNGVPLDPATETTVAAINTKLTVDPKTTGISRPTAGGTVAAGKNSVSIANVGAANGTVKTVTLKPGETVSFDAGAVNNTLDAIAYDATGTEFLIITIE